MPAYRSSAEAEIREAAVARIRQRRPNARIIHEINVSSNGPNRIDVVAVDRAEIIACEVKSAKDKLDRLPAQVASMFGAAHHVIAAIHEKFLVEQETNQWAAHEERDGKFFMRKVPEGVSHKCEIWVYPERRRALPTANHDHLEKWALPHPVFERPLPASALDLLWRDELQQLCSSLRVSATRQSVMTDMVAALRWHCTGKELTRGICRLLRARQCKEADPEIIERTAA
ncbi:hypothetical protein [Mesorhizobium sp. AA23]|uniref:hypothetical protein n=1 Tax=Mesorhizobium sp. AA23 TaxID=1854058 RepID=UPI0007FBE4D1|nr:hypothetical protein [Mesorhizobium sp. AA23]OBQ89989.1 hypothetical protein A9K66_15190 [Mesorhizobium sp. AA23]